MKSASLALVFSVSTLLLSPNLNSGRRCFSIVIWSSTLPPCAPNSSSFVPLMKRAPYDWRPRPFNACQDIKRNQIFYPDCFFLAFPSPDKNVQRFKAKRDSKYSTGLFQRLPQKVYSIFQHHSLGALDGLSRG